MSKFFSLLWQPIRPFEFTAPVFDQLKYKLLALKPISTVVFATSWLRTRLTDRFVNERIVEIPWVLGNLPRSPARILDVGASESPLALMLASLGYQVTAVDLRTYPFTHPNLEIVAGDITKLNLSAKFDTVVCLSTLEHIGLPVYGGREMLAGDNLALQQMHRWLKPGGYLLLTVPAALKYQVRKFWRQYDVATLKHLLRLFKSHQIMLAVKNNHQQWSTVGKLPASSTDMDKLVDAVALVKAHK